MSSYFFNTVYQTPEDTVDATWRTVLSGVNPMEGRSRFRTGEIGSFRQLFMQWPRVLEDGLQVNDATAAACYDAMIGGKKNNRFITFDNGYVGLMKGEPAVGDRVYVLCSSPGPWLLRLDNSIINTSIAETRRELHKIVACAYIHEIMDADDCKWQEGNGGCFHHVT